MESRFTLEELIDLAERELISPGSANIPLSSLLSCIGGLALKDCSGSVTARKYLLGLLSHSEDVCRFYAFSYLFRASNLEPGEMVTVENCMRNQENKNILSALRRR